MQDQLRAGSGSEKERSSPLSLPDPACHPLAFSIVHTDKRDWNWLVATVRHINPDLMRGL